jgi:hypothetical protein
VRQAHCLEARAQQAESHPWPEGYPLDGPKLHECRTLSGGAVNSVADPCLLPGFPALTPHPSTPGEWCRCTFAGLRVGRGEAGEGEGRECEQSVCKARRLRTCSREEEREQRAGQLRDADSPSAKRPPCCWQHQRPVRRQTTCHAGPATATAAHAAAALLTRRPVKVARVVD